MSGWTADTWIAVIALVFSLLSAGGAAFAFFVRSTTKDEIDTAIANAKAETDKDIAKLTGTIERTRTSGIEHDRRLIAIETSLKVLPSKDDVHRIEMGVERLVGSIDKMNVEVSHLAKSSTSNGAKLDRLEQQRVEDARRDT